MFVVASYNDVEQRNQCSPYFASLVGGLLVARLWVVSQCLTPCFCDITCLSRAWIQNQSWSSSYYSTWLVSQSIYSTSTLLSMYSTEYVLYEYYCAREWHGGNAQSFTRKRGKSIKVRWDAFSMGISHAFRGWASSCLLRCRIMSPRDTSGRPLGSTLNILPPCYTSRPVAREI